jgi:hypothetical protein
VGAICAALDDELEALVETLDPEDPADQRAYADAAIPAVRSAIAEMRAVPGARENDEVAAFIDATEDALQQLEADPSVVADPAFGNEVEIAARSADLFECV